MMKGSSSDRRLNLISHPLLREDGAVREKKKPTTSQSGYFPPGPDRGLMLRVVREAVRFRHWRWTGGKPHICVGEMREKEGRGAERTGWAVGSDS